MTTQLLSYLYSNSSLAKEMVKSGNKPTIDDIMKPFVEVSKQLLEKIYILNNESLNLSNCMINKELPYDSIKTLNVEQLQHLRSIAIVLGLQKSIIAKLNIVITLLSI